MAAPIVISLEDPIFKLADTEAGLAAGEAFQCQLTSVALVPTSATNAIPATGCAPASSKPSKATYALALAWLQDWTDSGGGLSGYAYTEDTELKWFSLAVDSVDAPTLVATGQVYVQAGAYGGATGGPPALASTSWSVLGKPVIVLPA